MRVLVVAPHPDDEAIGCGGAILRHADRGDEVQVVFVTSGELALGHLDADAAWEVREAEAAAAADVLGVARTEFLRAPDWYLEQHVEAVAAQLAALLERHTPAVVYVPHPAEWHPDHRATYSATLGAAARCGLPAWALVRYEVWTPLESFDVIEDITPVMPRKLDAIRCYPSQREFDYVQAATGLAQYRGALAAKSAYAEVFDRCSEDDLEAARGAAAATLAAGP